MYTLQIFGTHRRPTKTASFTGRFLGCNGWKLRPAISKGLRQALFEGLWILREEPGRAIIMTMMMMMMMMTMMMMMMMTTMIVVIIDHNQCKLGSPFQLSAIFWTVQYIHSESFSIASFKSARISQLLTSIDIKHIFPPVSLLWLLAIWGVRALFVQNFCCLTPSTVWKQMVQTNCPAPLSEILYRSLHR